MRFPRLVALLAVVVAAVFGIGCTPPTDPMLDLIDTDLRKTKVNDLSRTMDFIFSERRFDQKEFEGKISSGLNRWVSYSGDNVDEVDWKLDPWIAPTLDAYDDLAILNRTHDLTFVDADAYYIQQSAWVATILKRVTESTHLSAVELYRLAADDYKPTDETEDPISEIVKRLHPDLDDTDSQNLADAFKYFDWVVRNIQLLPAVDPSDDDLDDLDELRLNDREGLAAAGIAGTGYQRFAWQTLLYSRGDYVDRAKLFMIGLQQLGLDSVMLGVKSDQEGADDTEEVAAPFVPWVVAVAIGDDYYLFDTQMALPLPGEKLGSFATLSEIRATPKMIDRLDLRVDESLEDETDYWVRGDQLKELVGWVYATPEGTSRRMKALENFLQGEQRLQLTQSPTAVKDRLPAPENLELRVWDTSLKTHQFRQAVREALKDVTNSTLSNRLTWHYRDEAYIDNFTHYRTSRSRYFDGRFETSRNSRRFNAIECFENLIYTDKAIEGLATNFKLQRRLGIRKAKGSDAAFNAADFSRQVRGVQAQMKLVRRDTGFFLSQAHFDNGSVSAAANWLKLLQDKEDADRWSDGVGYLLGRALESRKELDLAVEEYRSHSKSTQAHGNLIRVRLLLAAVKKAHAETTP